MSNRIPENEQARVECRRCEDTGVSSYGGALTDCTCTSPDQPAPTNLAEKLRERPYPRHVLSDTKTLEMVWRVALDGAADDLDRAIPPEVWGRVIEMAQAAGDRRPGWLLTLAESLSALDYVIATFCPPHIQQQHGWEPRTTDKETT